MHDPALADESDPLAAVRWAPRLPRGVIRRLYDADARGIVDEELIDEVGYALLDRCDSILRATAAHEGSVTCPRCGATIRRRVLRGAEARDEPLRCGGCGWATTWGAYFRTYQHKQLYGGGAVDAFRTYADRFPSARSPQEKMLAIDRLIHAYHAELTEAPTRPAAVNLLEGTKTDIVAFLDDLAYGDTAAQARGATRAAWQQARAKSERAWGGAAPEGAGGAQ